MLTLLSIESCMIQKETTDPASLLPVTIEEWKISDSDQLYDRENLHTYINGGAELYRSYGFKKLVSRTYAQHGQPDIIVDLFDMETSQNAFGVFSHARETSDSTFGQGSQYTQGLLLFWKNNYFVSILSSPETAASKKAVFDLARKIETAIQGEGPLPGILTLLPQPSLLSESVRYFRHYIWLNTYFFIADKNILHINEDTEAALAKYEDHHKRYILLLVQYKTKNDAVNAYNEFTEYYLPALSESAAVQIEDGTWTACQLADNLLIAVFNTPEKDQAIHLIENVREIYFRQNLT